MRFEVIGSNQGKESLPHFVVGEVQQVGTGQKVIPLDSKVAALVNHGQRTLHISFIIHKHALVIVLARQLVDLLVAVVKQTDEVGGRARGKPVVTKHP